MRSNWKHSLVPALLALSAWAQVPRPTTEPVELPIRAVTVFSDRARITRSAEVKLGKGVHRLLLPTLPLTADPESVGLEVSGAKLVRVEVLRAERGELPASEAEKALRELDEVRLQVQALVEQIDNRESERALLLRLRPTAPVVDAKGQARPLETAGWRDAMAFFEARLKADDDAIATLEGKQRELRGRVEEVTHRVAKLAAGGDSRAVHVEAIVEGTGANATLSLTYLALGARWYPTYDVRYQGTEKVELAFAALVSQQTGEDWPASSLVLSTAVPAALRGAPKLAVWKLGERERFVPTPSAKAREALATLTPQLAPDPLRARLREATDSGVRLHALEKQVDALKQAVRTTKTKLALLDETILGGEVGGDEGRVNRVRALRGQVQDELEEARRGKDVIKANALNDKLAQLDGLERVAERSATDSRNAEARGDKQQAERQRAQGELAEKKADELARQPAVGQEAGYAETTVALESSPASASWFSARSTERVPQQQVPFVTPRAWQLPSFAPDLPAALAGGYDFTFTAAQPETLRSGGEARRVPLHRSTFAAEPELTLVPALSSTAYLMANVVNESGRPLLRGSANLYVGADLVGQATVDTTSPGEKTRVPLGIDDAVKVERRVAQVASQKGVFVKDDVSNYEVRIELLSSRARPVRARVLDQVPLAGDEKVEVKLLSSDPAATFDKVEGTVEWKLTLAPGVKQTLVFSYQVVRPMGARLRQW